MRWNSVINASSDGDSTADITVYITQDEAAVMTLALKALVAANWNEFGPAHYVAIDQLIEALAKACYKSSDQLQQVKWWEIFEQLDAREWAEFAPRCELPLPSGLRPSEIEELAAMAAQPGFYFVCKGAAGALGLPYPNQYAQRLVDAIASNKEFWPSDLAQVALAVLNTRDTEELASSLLPTPCPAHA